MDYSEGQSKSEYQLNKELIYMVQKYPLLYEENHVYFRHSKQRHATWNEIAHLLKSTNKDCRARWKSLRDHWKRHKRYAESGRNLGQKKAFEYYDDLHFLNQDERRQEEMPYYNGDDSNLLISQVCTTVLERSQDQDALNGYCNFVATSGRPVNINEVQPKIEEVDLTMDEEAYNDSEPDSGCCVDTNNTSTQLKTHSPQEHKQITTELPSPKWPRQDQNAVINSTSGEMEDEYSIAGRRIGYQLRSVDDFQRTIAEKLISDIVFNAKMGNLTENSSINIDVTETQHLQNGRRPMPMQY